MGMRKSSKELQSTEGECPLQSIRKNFSGMHTFPHEMLTRSFLGGSTWLTSKGRVERLLPWYFLGRRRDTLTLFTNQDVCCRELDTAVGVTFKSIEDGEGKDIWK